MEGDFSGKKFAGPTGPHLWDIRAIRDLLWFSGAVLIIWLLYYLRAIVMPIFVGFLLAYLVNPLLTRAKEKWRIPFFVSIVFIFAMIILFLSGVIIWLGPILKDQSLALMENVPQYLQRLSDSYDIRLDDLAGQFKSSDKGDGGTAVVIVVKSIFLTTTEILLWLVLVPIYFIYFAWHFQSIIQGGRRYFLLDRYPQIERILRRMDEAVGTFFRARVFISVIVGVVFAVGWLLTDVPYWFLLGVVTGLFSIVPYLSIAGWLLAILLKYLDTALQGLSFDLMAVIFWPSFVFFIGNFLEGWVFTPWIHGRTTRLSPIAILTIVLVGGALAGFWGLLFSIPFAICLNIIVPKVLDSYADRS